MHYLRLYRDDFELKYALYAQWTGVYDPLNFFSEQLRYSKQELRQTCYC